MLGPNVSGITDNDPRIAGAFVPAASDSVLPGKPVTFDTDAQAVRIANDSRYGLSGSVWAKDPVRAYAIAKQLRTGNVTVNGGGGGANPDTARQGTILTQTRLAATLSAATHRSGVNGCDDSVA
jgi:hypothetical protein